MRLAWRATRTDIKTRAECTRCGARHESPPSRWSANKALSYDTYITRSWHSPVNAGTRRERGGESGIIKCSDCVCAGNTVRIKRERRRGDNHNL